MSLFTRNLKRCGQSITIQDRDVSIIDGLPREVFSNPIATTGIIKTLKGMAVFDDTNTERVATHEICIAYQAGITSERWVLFGTKRIKILTVENCCEKDEVLKLMCTSRGEDSKVVNQA